MRSADLAAVVLTTGEPTLEAALAALRAQSLPPEQIVVVRDRRPFSEAFNAGAAQVQAPFFVQVDADMLLDPGCTAALAAGLDDGVGLVVGGLRDPLLGHVVGIKLFRTRCFDAVAARDTCSSETDLAADLARAGWRTVRIGGGRPDVVESWATYGEHRPDYTPGYTYRKHVIEGAKYRYRASTGGLREHFGQLAASRHPAALIARIGLAHGIFRESDRELHGRLETDGELILLQRFLSGTGHPVAVAVAVAEPLPDPQGPWEERFRACHALGKALAVAGDADGFRERMAALGSRGADGWSCTVALVRGLADSDVEHDVRVVRELRRPRQRLLFACQQTWPVVGGAQSMLYDLVQVLARRRHAVTVATGTPETPGDPLATTGATIVRLRYPWFGGSRLRGVRTTVQRCRLMVRHLVLLRRGRFDAVVIAYFDWTALYLVLATYLLPIRLVIWLHGGETRVNRLRDRSSERFYTWALQRAHAVIAVSPDLASEAAAAVPAAADRIAVIPNGIDRRPLRAAPRGPERRYGFCAGRLEAVKNVQLLIRAFARADVPGLELVLAGGGSLAPSLARLSRELGVAERVHFTGPLTREQVFSHLHACTFAALPSHSEAHPVFLLEALSAGKPVVASDVTGNRDVIQHGKNGWLFPPGDVERCAELIREAATGPGLTGIEPPPDLDTLASRYLDLFAGDGG